MIATTPRLLAAGLASWVIFTAVVAGGATAYAGPDPGGAGAAAAGGSAPANPDETHSKQAKLRTAMAKGRHLARQRRHAQAAAEYEAALQLAREIHGQESLVAGRVCMELGIEYGRMGRYDRARPLLLRALRIQEAKLGKDDPRILHALENVAALSLFTREYAEAELLFLRIRKIQEARAGKDDPSVAAVLTSLGNVYVRTRRYAQAEEILHRSLRIQEAKLGTDHPAVARTLNYLAMLYKSTGDYARAERLYLRCLKIQKSKLGEDHPYVAVAQNNLANLYLATGEYAKAGELYLRAMKIEERRFGADDPRVAMTVNNLANVRFSTGQYAEAARLFLRSLKIHEATVGRDHPAVGTILGNLGGTYTHMGRYAEAEPLLRRSLRILETKLGKNHPEIIKTLANLANVYLWMGEYAEAKPLYLRCLRLAETTRARKHPDVPAALNNLAILYRSIGEYARAEPLFLQSLKIRQTHLGKDHPSVVSTLNNLAGLYGWTGRESQAEQLLLRALRIAQAKLGRHHTLVCIILDKLAMLHQARGDADRAEQLYLRSLRIAEAGAGKSTISTAGTLCHLARLYASRGADAEAESLLRRSLKIREGALGRDHHTAAPALEQLASLCYKTGRSAEAWALLERARALLLQARARAAASPLGRSLFQGQRQPIGNFATCLALAMGKPVDVLELLEQYRALGLRELLAEAKARSTDALGKADRQRVVTALAKINALNGALDRCVRQGRRDPALREQLRRAERDYDALLAELSATHQQLAATEAAGAVTSKEIVTSPALDDETAIVGWVAHAQWRWAYVIRKSGVRWINLSEGLSRSDHAALARKLLSAGREPAANRLVPRDLCRLYHASFAPLEGHLRGVKELIVIAHGWPAGLPVEMLLTDPPGEDVPMADWPWLAAKYRISYAPSVTTLDLLCRKRSERKGKKRPRALLALADPPFSADQLARMQSERSLPPGRRVAAASPPGDTPMVTRLLRFDSKATPRRLPGTRREARAIAGLWSKRQSMLLLGPDACERRLFEASAAGELRTYRYIHLATHGFVDPDRPELSGVVLARVPADKEYDGILHMREVFQLKLDADLVVLSACQTGLGKHLGGEGTLGLSTAFFSAGTPSIVMSLWDVDDTATALLMWRFYRSLKAGKAKAAALREAKAWLRGLTRTALKTLAQEEQVLRPLARGFSKVVTVQKGRRLPDRPYAHPHYWAGFVLTGDPR